MAKKINRNTEDFDSVMEDQIGSLGKLDKRVTSSGNSIDKLTEEEKASMEAFLNRGRANQKNSLGEESDNSMDNSNLPSISQSWIPLNIAQEMGTQRAQFYPSDWQFFIKPASVSAIKNWIAVNEEDPRAVYSVLNDILRTSVKVTTSDGKTIGWSKINTWDRFWFILKVREITFVKGESSITFEDECESCSESITFELKSNTLHYDFPDEELIEKHWYPDEGSYGEWIVEPVEYGLLGTDLPLNYQETGEVKLYIPKVGTDNQIIEWASAKANQKEKIDEVFVKFLSWLLPPGTPKTGNDFNKLVERIHKQYKGWSVEFFEFMDEVINNITVIQSETLKQVCPSCEEEAVSKVKFPNGIANLFKTNSIKRPDIKKFGSR